LRVLMVFQSKTINTSRIWMGVIHIHQILKKTGLKSGLTTLAFFNNQPKGVDHTWDKETEGQNQIDPEV